jgi:hypothetical protein
MKILAAISLLAAFTGCTNPTFNILNPGVFVPGVMHPRGSVWIDPAFNEEERATIHEGMRQWHEDTDGCVALTESRKGHKIHRRDHAPNTYGRTNYLTGEIELDPGRVGDSGLHTVMHELGHLMGLTDHDDRDPRGLMTTLNNTSTRVDPHTRARFVALWDCE